MLWHGPDSRKASRLSTPVHPAPSSDAVLRASDICSFGRDSGSLAMKTASFFLEISLMSEHVRLALSLMRI